MFTKNGCRKSLSVPGGLRKTDILLDDYSRNLHDWAEAGAIGVKLLNDINNTHGTWINSENPLERTAVNYTETPENMLQNLLQGAARTQQRMEQRTYRERVRNERARKMDEQYRETIDAIKNHVNILDLASDLGYHVVKDSTHHSLKEHDSVVFYESSNTFCRFSTAQASPDGRPVGGSVIDFVLHFNEADGLGLPVHNTADAIRYLKDTYRLGVENVRQDTRTDTPQQSQTGKAVQQIPFRLPDPFPNDKSENPEKSHMYAYLCKTRAIDNEVVLECQKRRLLYEDKAHNVVFVGRDKEGKAIFGTRRSTLSFSKWRRDVAGSDQSSGWYVDNKADTLYVTEAPIDALSIMTLRKQMGKKPQDVNYLATTGTGKLNVIMRRLQENPDIKHIVMAFDNDSAGNLATERAAHMIKEKHPDIDLRRYVVKEGKDVNEYLQKKVQRDTQRNKPEKSPDKRRTVNRDPAFAPSV